MPIFYIVWQFVVSKTKIKTKLQTLILFSLLFYSYFLPIYLLLLISSISFNFILSKKISKCVDRASALRILTIGIVSNILLLGYFKYTNFFIQEINILLDLSISEKNIALPLAISFFTFQQIGFLMDVYNKKIMSFSYLKYFAFVAFFPQLIAGPIIKYNLLSKEFDNINLNFNSLNVSIGMCIFLIGLAKKIIIADNLGYHSDTFFSFVDDGNTLSFFGSWLAALFFTVQIYFDFSGYCDMAFGLAKMSGITIPINFNSPYKSKNLVEYWQRWHITLSKFLTEYIHLPLSIFMARNGIKNIYAIIIFPVVITFLISGLWHGAGRTFIIWGIMHGLGICFVHILKQVSKNKTSSFSIPISLKIFITFIFVTFTMVMFRSQSLEGAMSIYKSMIGLNGINISSDYINLKTTLGEILPFINFYFEGFLNVAPAGGGNFNLTGAIFILAISLIIIFAFPNSYQIMKGFSDTITHEKIKSPKYILMQPNIVSLLILSFFGALSILMMNTTVQFIYFQF